MTYSNNLKDVNDFDTCFAMMICTYVDIRYYLLSFAVP